MMIRFTGWVRVRVPRGTRFPRVTCLCKSTLLPYWSIPRGTTQQLRLFELICLLFIVNKLTPIRITQCCPQNTLTNRLMGESQRRTRTEVAYVEVSPCSGLKAVHRQGAVYHVYFTCDSRKCTCRRNVWKVSFQIQRCEGARIAFSTRKINENGLKEN